MARSKKQVEPILSAMGVFTAIISALVELVKEFGGTMESIYNLATPEGRVTLEKVAQLIVGASVIVQNAFLRCISGDQEIFIDACDGSEGLADASDVFARIDPDFEKYGANGKGRATGKTAVTVHEMVKDAIFADMFTSACQNVHNLLFTPHQIKKFCVTHREWLRKDGCGTFFLFESNGEIFVADVHFHSDDLLRVYVSRFENAYVWIAERRYRLVTPKLA